MSSYLSFRTVTQNLVSGIKNADSELRKTIEDSGDAADLSPVRLLMLQKLVHEWTAILDMTAGINKAFSDVMRSIVQKF